MKTVNFLKSTYIENSPPRLYDTIRFLNREYYNFKGQDKNVPINDSIVCEYYPDYFDYFIKPLNDYGLRTTFQVHGHCILFSGFEDVYHYMKSNFKSSFRNNLKRRSKALESCFNINKKMYYGKISREEYGIIMAKLYIMLKKRFQYLGERNKVLEEWELYEGTTLPLILNEKASLFVIYNDSEPIYISLNYHCKKIFHQGIPSFDINYLKFGLGNLGVFELVKWCLKNNYLMLDMAYGAFGYKLKWCNHTYNYEKHIFYKKGSLTGLFMKYIVLGKGIIIRYLLTTYVHKMYKKIKTLLLKKEPISHVFSVEIIKRTEVNLNKYEQVDINTPEFNFLKMGFHNFLYKHFEHQDDVKVYKLNCNGKEIFILKGKKEIQKLTYDT